MSLPQPRLFVATALLLAACVAAGTPAATAPDLVAPSLTSAPVVVTKVSASGYDGVVQAVRQTVVAAQVAGAVVAVDVKAGDTVKSGQVLLRLDARAAEQIASARGAQAQAARADQEAATRDFERQQQLFQQHYISQAALDRAEAQHRSTQAQAAAQRANAGAARMQSAFYVVRAPYGGVVAEVAAVLGEMAMPGRALLTLYDPAALRVSAALPQTAAARVRPGQPLQIEVPGVTAGRIAALRSQLLPTVDPATHTVELRLDLPSGLAGMAPGMFARAWLPGTAGEVEERLLVPARAIARRAEMTALYVLGADGRPLLRQVRLGRSDGEQVEVLAGVSAGERVALDPQAAARVR